MPGLNAQTYLLSQGWAGPGHPLNPTAYVQRGQRGLAYDPKNPSTSTASATNSFASGANGLIKPLLVSKKSGTHGLGRKIAAHEPARGNEWWLKGFESALGSVGNSGASTPTGEESGREKEQKRQGELQKSVNAQMGRYGGLYSYFLSGGVVGGTLEEEQEEEVVRRNGAGGESGNQSRKRKSEVLDDISTSTSEFQNGEVRKRSKHKHKHSKREDKHESESRTKSKSKSKSKSSSDTKREEDSSVPTTTTNTDDETTHTQHNTVHSNSKPKSKIRAKTEHDFTQIASFLTIRESADTVLDAKRRARKEEKRKRKALRESEVFRVGSEYFDAVNGRQNGSVNEGQNGSEKVLSGGVDDAGAGRKARKESRRAEKAKEQTQETRQEKQLRREVRRQRRKERELLEGAAD